MKCSARDKTWHDGFNPPNRNRDDIGIWASWAKEHGLKETIDLFHTYNFGKCEQCKITAAIFCLAVAFKWNKIRRKT